VRLPTLILLVKNDTGFNRSDSAVTANGSLEPSGVDGLEFGSEAIWERAESSLIVNGRLDRASGAVPVHWLLRQLGDRWSLAIIAILQLGPARFAKLKKSLGTVSHRILALSLKKLERDGLVSRFEQPCTPPQVTYALSALGHSLLEQLQGLDHWVHKNRQDILAANHRYDSVAETRLRDLAWNRPTRPF
jgi:DNA-binding HxlR family transcriptional regulator